MATSYPMSGGVKPKVEYRAGLWWYCGFSAKTVSKLQELVEKYMVDVPRNPIFRNGGAQ